MYWHLGSLHIYQDQYSIRCQELTGSFGCRSNTQRIDGSVFLQGTITGNAPWESHTEILPLHIIFAFSLLCISSHAKRLCFRRLRSLHRDNRKQSFVDLFGAIFVVSQLMGITKNHDHHSHWFFSHILLRSWSSLWATVDAGRWNDASSILYYVLSMTFFHILILSPVAK
jgi:hypothetical protein